MSRGCARSHALVAGDGMQRSLLRLRCAAARRYRRGRIRVVSSTSTATAAITATCTGAVIDGQVGGLFTTIGYSANPAAPCLSGAPMDHRGAWLPFQPEDGGTATDRQYLYNVFDWVKSL